MSNWDRYGNENDFGSTGRSGEEHNRGREWANDLRERARHGISDVQGNAQEMSGRFRRGFGDYFHDHPLLVGAGALALGVAIGMMMPATKQEDRWLGEPADRLKERTKEMAGRLGDAARSSIHEARETARSEMEGRGLDTEKLKQTAQETLHDAREVASKAAQEAGRTAKEEVRKGDKKA